jgi:hypothetical protein
MLEESTNVNLVILSEPKATKTLTGSHRHEGDVYHVYAQRLGILQSCEDFI